MITRENYEEFFLLYVDNELSTAEKSAVERFVEENPDLQEEWEATLQCKLTPDHTTGFGDLGLLRKTETIDQDQLLLYIDRELDPEAATKVGAALQHDKTLQQEFAILQKTIAKPDTSITFPDKSTLYRKEERRVVYLPWLRFAAAAAVVGVIVLVIFRYGHNNNNNNNNTPEVIAKKIQQPAVTPATPQPLDNKEENVAVAPIAPKKQTATKKEPQPEPQQIAQTTREELATTTTTTEPEPATHVSTVAQAGNIRTAAIEVKADKPLPATTTVSNPNSASFATQALLADNNNIEDQEEGDGEEPSRKKHKLRGLFRKVSRVLDKSANRDDDDKHSVLIGGFQFALK